MADAATDTVTRPRAPSAPPTEGPGSQGHRTGQVLAGGRYVLRELLGVGGMGEVYVATDTRLQMDVAVKCLNKAVNGHPECLKRFRIEALGTAQIAHPHIVKVIDVGLDLERHPFFVMELLTGITLFDLLALEKRLPAARAVKIARQVLDGLASAHRHMIHRDLKPRNIMVTQTGHGDFAKILDFGIAKIIDGTAEDLTLEDQALGTPGYMAPEAMARTGEALVSPLLDIFSVGVILYEMLTGRKPFAKMRPEEILAQLARGAGPTPVRMLVPEVPVAVEAAVSRAMSVDPAKRFPSAAEFASRLAAAIAPLEIANAAAIAEVDALEPGTIVADAFRIDARAGVGGFGVVYKATDLRLRRVVALKFLGGVVQPSCADEVRVRFEREGALAARVCHPNVVRIHGAGVWRGRPYLTLEYVEGQTLRDAWTSFDGRKLAAVVEQVAHGLAAIHASEVVHRDLSPDNVIVDAQGRAKVLDFGIARALDSQITTSQTRMQLGRIGYVAPEQARNPRDASWASDQWSLGAIVYEALTGAVPYRAGGDDTSDESTMMRIADSVQKGAPIPPAASANRTVTAALDAVVLRALRPSATDRFPTIVEFARALRRLMGPAVRLAVADALASPPPTRSRVRRRGRLLLSIGVAATLGALVGAGVSVWPWGAKTSAREAVAADASAPASPPPVVSSPPAAAPSAAQASVTIQSDPPGGTLVMGAERLALPVTLTRPVGDTLDAVVELAGHATAAAKLTFATPDAVEVIRLQKLAPPPPRSRTSRRQRRDSEPTRSDFRRRAITIEPIEPIDEDELRGRTVDEL